MRSLQKVLGLIHPIVHAWYSSRRSWPGGIHVMSMNHYTEAFRVCQAPHLITEIKPRNRVDEPHLHHSYSRIHQSLRTTLTTDRDRVVDWLVNRKLCLQTQLFSRFTTTDCYGDSNAAAADPICLSISRFLVGFQNTNRNDQPVVQQVLSLPHSSRIWSWARVTVLMFSPYLRRLPLTFLVSCHLSKPFQ